MALCCIVRDRRVIQHCLTSFVAFQHQTGKHNFKKKHAVIFTFSCRSNFYPPHYAVPLIRPLTLIILRLKSAHAHSDGDVLHESSVHLSSLVRVQANVVCPDEIPSVYNSYLRFHYAVLIKCSLSPTYHMQKYLKWEDVWSLDAHSVLVATTRICTGGDNKLMKLTKETNAGIVQFIISAGTTPVSPICMSSRHIDMII